MAARERPRTCCSSHCASARIRARWSTTTPRPIAAAEPADRRCRHGGDAGGDGPQPRQPRAGFLAVLTALCRHGARPAGTLGELIEDTPDALWRRDMIEARRVARAPELRDRVAVDPPATAPARPTLRHLVAGLGADGAPTCWPSDAAGRGPAEWARAASRPTTLLADRLVAEVNQGGDSSPGAPPDRPDVPCAGAATRGKWLRAEPVAALYERGPRACTSVRSPSSRTDVRFRPRRACRGRSPDRLDALVWAVTDLMWAARAAPGAPVFARDWRARWAEASRAPALGGALRSGEELAVARLPLDPRPAPARRTLMGRAQSSEEGTGMSRILVRSPACLRARPEAKAIAVGTALAWAPPGQPVWTRATMPPSPARASAEPIVYRGVRMIAEAAASVPCCSMRATRARRITRCSTSSRGPARSDGRRLPRGLVRLPAGRRQRLRRGGGVERDACASCTRCAPTACR